MKGGRDGEREEKRKKTSALGKSQISVSQVSLLQMKIKNNPSL